MEQVWVRRILPVPKVWAKYVVIRHRWGENVRFAAKRVYQTITKLTHSVKTQLADEAIRSPGNGDLWTEPFGGAWPKSLEKAKNVTLKIRQLWTQRSH